MNDPSKKIEVNLSSLLSLKAELLRKQTEVNKAKATRTTVKEFTASKARSALKQERANKKRDKNERVKEKGNKQEDKNGVVYETEDTLLLAKSQRILQAKSKFYDRMSRAGGGLNTDDNCLVQFNRKRQDERDDVGERDENRTYSSDSDSSSDVAHEDDDDNNEEDWVEYTDCLGRTRRCLREDLEVVKRRDAELAASMPERLMDQSKANWMLDAKQTNTGSDDEELPIGPMPPASVFNDGCSLMSKHDEQRANWEKKEMENYEKPDVHYQDVFFDEARQHGVGYYAFSTDEEERKRQQRDLEETRKRTISEQKDRDALRTQRDKIIAERVLAAKNRQRARLGLPPLEESEEKQQEEPVEPVETKEERKEKKRAEKLQKKNERAEQERELERQQHVRPWDEDKQKHLTSTKSNNRATSEEPEWTYKPERLPMSQEEWNERKRAERKPEFAPVPESEERNSQMKRTNFRSMPPPDFTLPFRDSYVAKQSTKKQFQPRNYEGSHDVGTPNALNDRSGAAIPPPVDLYDSYSLPPSAKKSRSQAELESSIEAGLLFLRQNYDKNTLSTKDSWTAKADY